MYSYAQPQPRSNNSGNIVLGIAVFLYVCPQTLTSSVTFDLSIRCLIRYFSSQSASERRQYRPPSKVDLDPVTPDEPAWERVFHKQILLLLAAKPTFELSGGVVLNLTTNIVEGDVVTFTCNGNVGSHPIGQLQWYYFLSGQSTGSLLQDSLSGVNISISESEPVRGDCSYSRTSVLELQMQRSFNNFVVRCTAQQDIFSTEGDGYIQTPALEVLCKIILAFTFPTVLNVFIVSPRAACLVPLNATTITCIKTPPLPGTPPPARKL